MDYVPINLIFILPVFILASYLFLRGYFASAFIELIILALAFTGVFFLVTGTSFVFLFFGSPLIGLLIGAPIDYLIYKQKINLPDLFL